MQKVKITFEVVLPLDKIIKADAYYLGNGKLKELCDFRLRADGIWFDEKLKITKVKIIN